ncbi:MAG TPA: translocation/assembly module TamB domain-containing protein, partial [Bacteroidales bacterium]|nr:translocation/assembly module TamB domain-containing protein [Bacteroidales bacterium]
QTNARDFTNFKIPGKKKFEVPEVLYKLGNITFDGSFTGFTTDFVTYGEFETQLGELRTDISLRPDKSDVYLMKGLLSGSRINLGSLTGTKVLGKLNIKANVDGSASSFKRFAGNLKGTVDSVEINNYTYRNIDLNGIFTDKTWDGSINVVDKNIKMDLLGMLNFKDTLPEFDFTLNLAHADLHKLNIDQKDTVSSISALITSNFKGNNIDNLDGEIKLLNSTIKRNNKTIDLYDFSVRTYKESSSPVLSLRTDFVNADIRGKYNFAGLSSMISSTLASIMPSVFRSQGKKVNPGTNNFTFEVNFRNTSELSEFLNAGIILSDKSYIRGSVSPDTVINIHARASFLNVHNIILNNFAFDAKSDASVLNADMVTSSLVLPGKTELPDFRFTFKTNPDNFIFNVDWDNKQSILERGNIRAKGNVSESSAGNGNPVLKVNIDSTVVYTRNKPWQISQSSITIDTNAVKVGRIHIASEDRFYDIVGAVSHDPADTLYLKFRGIDISPLNYLIQKNDSAALPLDLKGIINGGISLTNVYKDLLLQGSLIVNKFSILGSDYGDVSVNAGLNNAKKVVEINAGNNLGGKRMFDVKGFYDPEIKYINLDAEAHQLPVEALNPLLKSFASGIRGTTSGKVKLSGETNDLELTGAVKAENVSIKIDYLQTVYKVNDSVNFDRQGFRFNNVRFTDIDGHMATISGLVSHRNFKDYGADLTINMSNDFMVLNTTLQNNPTFYGKVYGSGVTKIKAGPNLLSFDIVAKTGKNSKLSIPLNSGLSVSEYPFVSFVNPRDTKEVTNAKQAAQSTTLGLNINIDLNVTPEAVVELIFDPKVGDIMSGSGSGMLNITLNPKGDFAILGDYTLEQGSYLFTLGNILNKKFEVENGGKIIFNGNLDDAEIDLRTKYKKFNTSLFPIIQEQQYAQEKVAVEPQLILTGKLFNPTVNFEINLPNANEQAKAYLRNGISSDEELSRQFLYLLVTQSFYSEQSSTTSGTSNPTGSSAVAATTFEMLSNQLSNWISQINENFNLGLSYKPGSGDKVLNPDELNVAFETQVLDDRVLINGNFDYKTNSTIAESATRLTGDFDASVRITDRLRFKVFNRFNDTFLGIRGPYTQGIGIFYRQEFGHVSDLFRKKGSMKKEDEPAVIVNK